MPKYYSAKIRVEQTFEVNIVAEDEISAKRQAREIDFGKSDPISSQLTGVELVLEGEVSYDVGTRIKHFLFGIGEIKGLVRTTNANNHFGHSATVEFENGVIKNIHLPLAREKVEILG